MVSWCLFFYSLRITIVHLFCLDASICTINLIDCCFYFVIKGPPACSVPGGCPWMKKYNYIWIFSWYSLLHMHAKLSCNKLYLIYLLKRWNKIHLLNVIYRFCYKIIIIITIIVKMNRHDLVVNYLKMGVGS